MLSLNRLRHLYRRPSLSNYSALRASLAGPVGGFRLRHTFSSGAASDSDSPICVGGSYPEYQLIQEIEAQLASGKKQFLSASHTSQAPTPTEKHRSTMVKAQANEPEFEPDCTDWIGMDDPANSIETLVGGHGGPSIVPKDAEDPFHCDDADMRAAKMKSKFAWVSLCDSWRPRR